MKEIKRTDMYVLIKNDVSTRIQDVRTMEERVVDCEKDARLLIDLSCDEFDCYALDLFNS